jgi:uncharacterized protein with PIN domain
MADARLGRLARWLRILGYDTAYEVQLRLLHQGFKIELDVNHQRSHRCADCNVALVAISPDYARALVLPFVAEQYREFFQCHSLSSRLWPATHWQDLLGRG